MKKALILLLLSTSVLAAGPLYQEFMNREQTLQSVGKFKVYRMLRESGRSKFDLREIEEVTQGIHYVTRDKNDEVCSINVEEQTMSCYNAVGLGTYFAGGDSD